MSYTHPATFGTLTYPNLIAVFDRDSEIAAIMVAPASAAYPLANLAIYVPFSVSHPCTAQEGWVVTGATAGGNFDIGIYDAAGSRLTSSGSTARTASAMNNTTTMTNQVLVPGVRYFMAFAADTTANYFAGVAAAGVYEASGILESTSSFALPASPTLARTTRAYVPHFGLTLHSVGF